MDPQLPAAPPLVGSPARHQVITVKKVTMHVTESDLAQRRRASARFAWALGAVALGLYIVGFFIQR